MKEHLLNLIYLQYSQERILAELSLECEETNIDEAYVDVLGVVLDIIGYPKYTEDTENITDDEIYCRDWFYQGLTDIAMDIEDEVVAKQKIEEFYNWICGETLELYKNNKLKTNDFVNNIMMTIK